jgi:hypothetical protein
MATSKKELSEQKSIKKDFKESYTVKPTGICMKNTICSIIPETASPPNTWPSP